jgi:hypothetical protein
VEGGAREIDHLRGVTKKECSEKEVNERADQILSGSYEGEPFIARGRVTTVKVCEMPSEITNIDQFVSLSEGALECRVKRAKDLVKLKLRTPHQLYTHKVKVERADDIIKRLKCEIVEV